MKKNHIYLIIFFEIIFFLIILVTKNKITFINNFYVDKNNENIRGIQFDPYSNENNLLKILVTVTDEEYGLNKITYKNNKNNDITIQAYNKNKVSFDYIVENDGEYTFTAYNKNGDKIEKKLIIDSNNKENDTLGNLIDINITPILEDGYSVAKKANVNINFKYGKGTNYYKIGNSSKWNTYDNEFQIDSYKILNNNLQENDNQTITIFAKKEDNANNKILISKSSTELDLDMPNKPQINITKVDPYVTLTSDNVTLNTKFSITFDSRDDIKNYYSLDNKNSWIEYTGEVSCNAIPIIYAKSVKNISGLTVEASQIVNPSASDAFPLNVFDKTNLVNFYAENSRKFILDSSTWGKNLHVIMSSGAGDAWSTNWYFTNNTGKKLYTWTNGPWYSQKDIVFNIPLDSYNFIRGGVILDCHIHQIKITD